MQHDLVGYLLGALDGPEQEQTRRELLENPALRDQLSQWENQLAPLESLRWAYPPPKDLAARTCAMVFTHEPTVAPRRFPALRREVAEGPANTRPRIRGIDVAVAAGILAMCGLLIGPALLTMRDHARLVACQDNLRQMGQALPRWADLLQGYLPHIPATGNAGVAGFYGPQLVTAGFVTEHPRFLCPDSELARDRGRFQVPRVQTVYLAKGAELCEMQRTMGGSYTYGLGYLHGGRLLPRRFAGRRHVPLMSDFPGDGSQAAQGHSAQRVNVLFEDGRVTVVVRQLSRVMSVPSRGHGTLSHWREFYVSDRGLVEAGQSEADVVLAPSWVRPIPIQLANSLFPPSDPREVDLISQFFDMQSIDVGSVLRDVRRSPYPWSLTEPPTVTPSRWKPFVP